MGCGHDCGSCPQSGSCGGCSGCGGALMLTAVELDVLHTLEQIPFLPVARRADTMDPVCLEDTRYTADIYTRALLHLERKGLITLDYDQPIRNFSWDAYAGFPVHGSMALTARGQRVLELLAIQGVQSE